MERNCWLKEENKSQRPCGFRMPNESANSALDRRKNNTDDKETAHVEYLLCGLTFPTDSKILLGPNIWIADTAANVHHMTAHRQGLTSVRKATNVETIRRITELKKLLQKSVIYPELCFINSETN